ncbi:MAG: hypothetical protein V4651_04045, partial [Bacteroidota bacterium]
MLLNRLTYLTYLMLSRKPFTWKRNGYNSFLTEETLHSLKSRLKYNAPHEVKTTDKLDTNHLNIGSSLLETLNLFKKPAVLYRDRTAGIKHDRVLYTKLIHGIQSRVLYSFINEEMASISFQINVDGPQHLSLINQ